MRKNRINFYVLAILIFIIPGSMLAVGTKVSKGPVLYMDLDEPPEQNKVADKSGYDNHGVISGRTYDAAEGSGYFFNGSSNRITVPLSPTLELSDSFTVMAWVKTEDRDGGIAHQHNGGSDGNFVFGVWRGNFRFGRSETVKSGGFDSWEISDGRWHHVVGMYDKAKKTVYHIVDGRLVKQYEELEPVSTKDIPFVIGNENNRRYGLKGNIDEVRVYNRTVSKKEIAKLFKSSRPKSDDKSKAGTGAQKPISETQTKKDSYKSNKLSPKTKGYIDKALNKGVNVDELLMKFVGNDDLAAVKYLFSKGADVKAEDRKGLAALHVAASKASVDMAKLLISKGAKVNSKIGRGETPLHYAAQSNNTAVAKYLLSKGAKVNELSIQKRGGWLFEETPMRYAAKRGYKDMVSLLEKEGAIYTSIDAAAVGDDIRLRKIIKKTPEALLETDAGGLSPLHWAAKKGSIRCAAILLDSGMDVNLRTKVAYTPLHLAASGHEQGHLEIVKLLIDRGAKVDARDNFKRTPLNYAMLESKKIYTEAGRNVNAEIVALLKNYVIFLKTNPTRPRR